MGVKQTAARPESLPSNMPFPNQADSSRADSAQTEWLEHVRPLPFVRSRLFCLPHAGGDASQYVSWQQYFGLGIQVCPVQLPGRGRRIHQPPYRSARAAAETAYEHLGRYFDLPAVLFGHSMGALIVYELACILEDHGTPPQMLVVAGKAAPHLPPARARNSLGDEELIADLRALGGTPHELLEDRSALQFYLPLIRSDLAVVDDYIHRREAPLSCPILCLGGMADSTTGPESLAAWSRYTRAEFDLRIFPGDHFFVRSETPLVCEAIVRMLRNDSGRNDHGGDI
jgi:surfactin synthase thioesterase subunit